MTAGIQIRLGFDDPKAAATFYAEVSRLMTSPGLAPGPTEQALIVGALRKAVEAATTQRPDQP